MKSRRLIPRCETGDMAGFVTLNRRATSSDKLRGHVPVHGGKIDPKCHACRELTEKGGKL